MLHLNANLKRWGYLALFACILFYNSCAIYIEIPPNPCNLPIREATISCHRFNVDFQGQGWITFIGDGNVLEVTAFANGNFMDQIRIHEGADCNNLTLVASTNTLQPSLTFQSVDGQRYYIELVDSFGDESTVEICNDNVANNDLCIDAIEWWPNTLMLGSLENATNEALPPECIQENSRGVWFTMQGDGQTYNLNLLNSDLTVVLFFATLGSEEIHYNIYEGDCSNLVCVLGKDGLGPTTFATQVGKTYYIYVTFRIQNPNTFYNFVLTKSTCIDLIDGITIESCPGSDQSTIKVSTTQPNVTFAVAFNFEDEGIDYSVVLGDPDSGPITSNNGEFPVSAPLEGYVLAFVGNDPYSALCWDYVYFNVTGNEPDLTPPKAKCKDHTLELDQQGMATLEVSMVNKGSSDNCSIVTRTLSATNFTCDDLGTHTVTLTVEDAGGLSASCTSTVTVVDNLPPVPVCQNTSVILDANGTKAILNDQIITSITENCTIQDTQLNPAFVDCDDAQAGTANIQVVVTDNSGNTNSCTAIVTVTDETPPIANCMDATVTLDNDGEGLLTPSDVNNNSSDACGISRLNIDANVFDCDDIGQTISVELTVTDNNLNTNSCTANVTVVDDTSPTAVCKTATVEIQPNGQYILELSDIYDDINSKDNCNIAGVNFTSTTFTCDELDQTFQILVTVVDASGNSSNCNASVSVVLGTALPNEWNTSDIGQITLGNAYSFDPCANSNPANGEFTITGSGNNAVGTTSDNVAFAYQSLCGDKTITAKIENVEPNGYGGLMIRESSASGAKQVAIFSNMTNLLRHEYRSTTNGPKIVGSFFKPAPYWLRLQRQGDWIFAYYSTTGTNFTYVHAAYVPMQSCVEIGLASFTFLPNSQNATVFSNVSIMNSNGTLGEGENLEDVHDQTNADQATPDSNLKLRNFSVFPNPNSGKFTVELDHAFEQEIELVLFNQFGQEIERKIVAPQAMQVEWNISNVGAGVYFIQLNGQGIKAQVKEFTVTQ